MSLPLQAQVEPNIGCLGVCNVADTVSSGLRYDRQQPLHIRHCRGSSDESNGSTQACQGKRKPSFVWVSGESRKRMTGPEGEAALRGRRRSTACVGDCCHSGAGPWMAQISLNQSTEGVPSRTASGREC